MSRVQMGGWARPRFCFRLLDDVPPVPVSALYTTSTDVATITFDKPLQAGAVSVVNWNGIADFGLVRDFSGNGVVGASAAGSVVTCGMTRGGITSGPNEINYAGSPADVIGANGLPVLPFTGFPLTVV